MYKICISEQHHKDCKICIFPRIVSEIRFVFLQSTTKIVRILFLLRIVKKFSVRFVFLQGTIRISRLVFFCRTIRFIDLYFSTITLGYHCKICISPEHCKDCKNFNSMFAIVSGLGHGSVSRLKSTWEKIPSKYGKLFEVG